MKGGFNHNCLWRLSSTRFSQESKLVPAYGDNHYDDSLSSCSLNRNAFHRARPVPARRIQSSSHRIFETYGSRSEEGYPKPCPFGDLRSMPRLLHAWRRLSPSRLGQREIPRNLFLGMFLTRDIDCGSNEPTNSILIVLYRKSARPKPTYLPRSAQ